MGKRVALDEYYLRLGLTSTASQAEVKRAYRRLRAKYHPDRNKGHESKVEPLFKSVQEAFEILTGVRQPSLHSRAPSQDSGHPAQPRQPESRTGQANQKAWSSSGGWGAFSANDRPSVRGANRHAGLYVPLEVALNGGDVLSSYQVIGACRQCHGMSARVTVEQCSDCGGSGQSPEGTHCGACSGAGRTARNQWCPTCQSTGVETYQKEDKVTLPPGAWDGQRLVVAEAGLPGLNGGAAGDAIFSVVIVCGPDVHRDRLNLTKDLQVDFVTATLGGAQEATVLGRDLLVTIPANAQPGTILRLPAHGLSDGSGNQGELRLRLILSMPVTVAHLTNEQRRLFREMFEDAARRSGSDV